VVTTFVTVETTVKLARPHLLWRVNKCSTDYSLALVLGYSKQPRSKILKLTVTSWRPVILPPNFECLHSSPSANSTQFRLLDQNIWWSSCLTHKFVTLDHNQMWLISFFTLSKWVQKFKFICVSSPLNLEVMITIHLGQRIFLSQLGLSWRSDMGGHRSRIP